MHLQFSNQMSYFCRRLMLSRSRSTCLSCLLIRLVSGSRLPLAHALLPVPLIVPSHFHGVFGLCCLSLLVCVYCSCWYCIQCDAHIHLFGSIVYVHVIIRVCFIARWCRSIHGSLSDTKHWFFSTPTWRCTGILCSLMDCICLHILNQ